MSEESKVKVEEGSSVKIAGQDSKTILFLVILLSLTLLVIAFLGVSGISEMNEYSRIMVEKEIYTENSYATLYDSSKYQAVFLTNGHVYFAKMKKVDSDYIVIEDVYYMKSIEDGSVVKLGSELLGPENRMVLNKDQVLFWEDLRTDSEIVKEIENYGK